jgi:hypothetical protein
MSGLIWANIGKSISDIGATYGKQGFQMELMRLEEEKALRLDEIKRSRDIADIPLRARATADAAPVLAQGDAAAAPVRAAGEAAAAPVRAAGEAIAAPIRAQGEAQGLIAKVQTPGYTEAKQKDADAGESTSTKESRKVTTAAASFELSQKSALGDLRTRLSKTTDPEQRGPLEQMIKDLSGSSTKSYGDMVTAAGHYRMLAQNLRKDAELAYDDADRNDMLKRARYYEQEADGILRSTVDRRLGKDTKPSTGPNSSQSVGTAGTSKYKEGDIVSLKSGGKGKVVNVNGKLMVQPL